ncbi:MAG: glutathione peroxidase [Bacteroidetes bacterium]|nr:glutathione peroxidase [Bacteroidota bacterium]
MQSFYELEAQSIEGKAVSMSAYKGKKIMIVNVASRCGYTSQYTELQALYEKYKNKNFVILGFPCNQFMGQEPGTEEEIQSFCQKNYGVSFPLFSKVEVKGTELHPIYRWLTQKSLNGVEDAKVSWNFNKFLIDEEGNYVVHLESGAKPMDAEITAWIEGKK